MDKDPVPVFDVKADAPPLDLGAIAASVPAPQGSLSAADAIRGRDVAAAPSGMP